MMRDCENVSAFDLKNMDRLDRQKRELSKILNYLAEIGSSIIMLDAYSASDRSQVLSSLFDVMTLIEELESSDRGRLNLY